VTDINHIHMLVEGEWVCGRTLAFDDQELLHCEARDPEEESACEACAEQLLNHFGDPMHVH
jgi:hypothetical protein